MRSDQFFFELSYPFFIFRGKGKGLFYVLVKDSLHFRSPSLTVLLIFKPFFGRPWDTLFQFPVFHSLKNLNKIKLGGPNGSRTRVLALRGPRPRPLDDGTVFGWGERIRTPVSRSRACRPTTGRLPKKQYFQ